MCVSKITYHFQGMKMFKYLKIWDFKRLKAVINSAFDEYKLPRCEARIFWIDDDGDEIEVRGESDFIIFEKKNKNHHLHVTPNDIASEEVARNGATESSISNQTKVTPAAGLYDFEVHNHVECDSCLMSPIVGFRYKCIQCPNYDLCQNCEAKHIHYEHMMMRIPNKTCPSVIDILVTGRNSGHRHGKRSKSTSPFFSSSSTAKRADDLEAPHSAGSENSEQTSPTNNGKERYHGRKHYRRHRRNNFFSNLYDMMNDLAEGGGADAAAHAMGESQTSSNTTTSTAKPHITPTFTSNVHGFGNEKNPVGADEAASASHAAAKAAEIAAKVAHETALKAAKSITENMVSAISTTSSAQEDEKDMKTNKEKVDATTSPCEPESQDSSVLTIPSPTLETIAQFLDPKYVRTGIDILNNFSDMFSKVLDRMENDNEDRNLNYSNISKNSTTSSECSESSFLNSFGYEKKSDNKKSAGEDEVKQKSKEIQTGSDVSSHVEIIDLGSDSENESATESFVKLYAPQNSDTAANLPSANTTPQSQSVNNSNVMEFARLSADLKAHIAEEAKEDSTKTVEATNDSVDISVGDAAKTSTHNSINNNQKIDDEKRAVIVYHADRRINNSVHAMMAMGFSNEGAWLTQLLESVNGDIAEALDLMSAAQKHGSH